MKTLATLACLLALPALADTPMSAAEFDAYTLGKTLFYGSDGQRYGVEEYLPNRRVRWSFLDGKCKDGLWYENAGQICFIYEDNPEPQCWSFFQKSGGGLSARFENAPDMSELYEIEGEGEGEMLCLGPEVGV